MSVAVGLETRTGVWLAADAAILDADDTEISAFKGKLFSLYNLGIAGVGDIRLIQLVRELVFDDLCAQTDPDECETWLVRSFIPILRAALTHEEKWTPVTEWDVSLLIALNGNLFVLSNWAIWRPIETYTAIGAGASFSTGSMHTSRRVRSPKDRVERAVEAATYHSPACILPIFTLFMPK